MPPVTMRWQSVSREPAFTDRDWSTTDGIELYARDYGAGEGRARLPVICLHGMTRNSAGPYLSTEGLMRLADAEISQQVDDVAGIGEQVIIVRLGIVARSPAAAHVRHDHPPVGSGQNRR